MISWIKSSFEKLTKSSGSAIDDGSNDDQSVWVHIWPTTKENVGHAAIQVGGDKPKMKAEDPGKYMSLWPELFPSWGPFAAIPGPATSAKTLKDDMQMEGKHQENHFSNDFSDVHVANPLSFDKKKADLPPEKSYEIKGLDTKSMLAEMDKQEKAMAEGNTTYQLYPQVTVFDDIISHGAATVSMDLIDARPSLRQSALDENTKRYNCTTFAAHLLNTGGMSITNDRFRPWGLTPDRLASKIDQELNDNLASRKAHA